MAEGHKRHKNAFSLGSQCRRAGMTEKRMLEFYPEADFRDFGDYCRRCMVEGWQWQQKDYEAFRNGE